ncbi:MAG: phosphotransferase family protein [Nevskia sp.]|nr:phosphotransferase family protein [Nevskia sp.]
MDAQELAAKLARAWRERLGSEVAIENMKPLTAGASASTWRLEAAGPHGAEPLVLQLYAGGENFGFALNKAVQARVQSAAHRAGIPTPPVVLVVGPEDGLPEGFITPWLAGETLGKKIAADPALAAARKVLPAQCAQALARIHGLEPADFPDLALRPADLQLAELAGLHRGYGQCLPVFEAAIAWLRAHRPAEAAPRVVHGDFRNGNWIVDASGLRAVLDWELAHLGDPMEDLGWLCMRSWRFGRDELAAGGIARRREFLAHYAAAAGAAPDPAAVRYWEIFAALKWGVICQWFASQYLGGTVRELERAVIGRRVSETEAVLLDLLEGHGD